MKKVSVVLEQGVWARIATQYENGAYADAAKTAFIVLTEIIRDRSGNTGDGSKLIGETFGVDDPKITMADLSTKDGRDVQSGFQEFLRGMYKSIRNPLNHGHQEIDQRECDFVLTIISYAYSKIESATARYEPDQFKAYLQDEMFPSQSTYVPELVGTIPREKVLALASDLLSWIGEVDPSRLSKVFFEIVDYVRRPSGSDKDEDKYAQLMQLCTDELGSCDDLSRLRTVVSMIPQESWKDIGKRQKIRAEGQMLKSFEEGIFDARQERLIAGHLGLQIARIGKSFLSRKEFTDILIQKLQSDWLNQNYIGNYFIRSIPAIVTDVSRVPVSDKLCRAAIISRAISVRKGLVDALCSFPSDFSATFMSVAERYREGDPKYLAELDENDLPF